MNENKNFLDGDKVNEVIGDKKDKPVPSFIPDECGEHLIRRWGYPLTIKVDPLTTGAEFFSIGTEVIFPGKEIPLHRHSHSEEVVIIKSGVLQARLNSLSETVEAGGMVYAPRNTWMGFRNNSNLPAEIIWIFSKVGFERYVRDTSVKPGDEVIALSERELNDVRSKYIHEIELSAPMDILYPTESML